MMHHHKHQGEALLRRIRTQITEQEPLNAVCTGHLRQMP